MLQKQECLKAVLWVLFSSYSITVIHQLLTLNQTQGESIRNLQKAGVSLEDRIQRWSPSFCSKSFLSVGVKAFFSVLDVDSNRLEQKRSMMLKNSTMTNQQRQMFRTRQPFLCCTFLNGVLSINGTSGSSDIQLV